MRLTQVPVHRLPLGVPGSRGSVSGRREVGNVFREAVHQKIAPVQSVRAPVQSSSALVQNAGAPLQNLGALVQFFSAPVQSLSALVQSSSALLQNAGAPVHCVGALRQCFGAPEQSPSALLQNVGAPLQNSRAPVQNHRFLRAGSVRMEANGLTLPPEARVLGCNQEKNSMADRAVLVLLLSIVAGPLVAQVPAEPAAPTLEVGRFRQEVPARAFAPCCLEDLGVRRRVAALTGASPSSLSSQAPTRRCTPNGLNE